MNIYHRIWERFTVWMLAHNKFDYSKEYRAMSDSRLTATLNQYKQGRPWVDANIAYILSVKEEW